ncbi:MAG: SLC13 family permease [Firmicutes bacterium]|nr:SLC13 family permease [Bacillota bacterium]
MHISTVGAILGLVLAIFLIIKKVNPTYSLILGAVLGGVIGGVGWVFDGKMSFLQIFPNTVNSIMGTTTGTGIRGVVPAIIRILAAGVLAGVLIKSGAAEVISRAIIRLFGAKFALLALALSTLVLTAVGVFIDVAVITVAPVAITIAKSTGLHCVPMLLALIGGGKAGNVISPNPNTIATSGNLGVPLFDLMLAGLPAMLVGLAVSVLLAMWLSKKFGVNTEAVVDDIEIVEDNKDKEFDNLPSLWAALVAPIVVVLLLAFNPILYNIVKDAPSTMIDPMIALPIGGILGAIAMKKSKKIVEYLSFGLSKMTPVAIMFVGTGAIAGVIQDSNLSKDIEALFSNLSLSIVWIAPLAGIMFSAATGSTTAAATIASSAFTSVVDGKTMFLDGSISNLSAAAMIHSGAATLDHMPHGTFFHATCGSVNMDIKSRLKLIPYETVIGLCMTIVTTMVFGLVIR